MNQLKEVVDTNFYDYILVDKLYWKSDANNETESTNVYKIRNTLNKHRENMMELIENYEKIKEFDSIAL
jgi:hypothetical protein